MRKQILFVFILSLILFQGFVSNKVEVVDEKPYVLSTVGMLHDVVVSLLPSDIDKKLLLPAGTDPHVYVPTLSNIQDFNNADMIFSIGLDLEAQMHDALLSLSNSKPVYFFGEMLDESLLIQDAESFDPHIWFDLDLFSFVVDDVSNALVKQYPELSSEIIENTQTYKNTLEELDAYALSKLSSISPSQKWIVTTHDAFSYFARKYDFNVFTLKGVNTASDYSLFDKKRMHDIILENSLKAVFIEDSVSNRDLLSVLSSVNKSGLETKLGGYLYADSLGTLDSGYDTYQTMFKYNVDTVVNALK